MIKTNKIFKKFLCAVTAGTLVLTSIMPMTFAEEAATAAEHATETVEQTVEIAKVGKDVSASEGNLLKRGEALVLTDGELKNAKSSVFASTDFDALTSKVKAEGIKGYSFSFDFKPNVTSEGKLQRIYMVSKFNAQEDGHAAAYLALFDIYSDRAGCRGGFDAKCGEEVAITNNQWSNAECVILMNSDSSISYNWYVNGSFVGKGVLATSNKYTSPNGILQTMGFETPNPVSGVSFDNVKLSLIKDVEKPNSDFTAVSSIDRDENGVESVIVKLNGEAASPEMLKSTVITDSTGYAVTGLTYGDVQTVPASEGQSGYNTIAITLPQGESSEYYNVQLPARMLNKDGFALKNNNLTANGFQPVQIVKSGDKAYAETNLLNMSAEEKNFEVGISTYKKSDDKLVMTGYTSKAVTVAAGSKFVVGSTGDETVEITVPEGSDVIKGFLWNKSDSKAVKEAAVLGSYSVSVPGSVGFSQTAATEISISADFGADAAEKEVTIVITNSDSEKVYVDQVTTDKKGIAGLKFAVDADFEPTELKAVMTADFVNAEKPGDSVKTLAMSFKNATGYDSAAAGINTALIDTNKTEAEVVNAIEDVLENNYMYFGIDKTLFDGVDVSEAAALIYNELSEAENAGLPLFGDEADFDNMEKGAGLIKKLYIMAVTGNKGISNLFDYESELELSDDVNYVWYTKDYVKESVQRDITARMAKENISSLAKTVSSSNFTSQDQFYDLLKDSYILSIVKEPDGEKNLSEVLKNFAGHIGISTSLKSKTLTALKGMDIKTISALKSKVNELEEKYEETSGGSSNNGSGSGSGGGGSYKGGSSMVFGGETASTEKAEELIKDIFADMGDYEWAKKAVVYLAELGVVTGKTETEFSPSDNITREEFAAMLVRAFADDEKAADVNFSDADSNEWYGEYLAKAVAAGFINGYDDGRFGIGENITRQDMAVMISRAADYAGIKFSDSTYKLFDDDSVIADYAKEAVYKLRSAGIVNGVSERTFAPVDSAERAQAAKVIYELLNV